MYGVTRAGYYAWRQRPKSACFAQDRELQRWIQRLFAQHRGRPTPILSTGKCLKLA